MKCLILFVLWSLAPAVYGATLRSIAIAPRGAVLQSGSSQQFHVTCGYSDGSTDNCTAAGGATWTSSRAVSGAITVSSTGLATIVTDPGKGKAQPGYAIATADGVIGIAAVFGQHVGDSWELYPTPDLHEYKNAETNVIPPMTLVVGSIVSIGEGYQINGYNPNPMQAACAWSSSNTAVATVDSIGHVTGVSPGSVTITCTIAGNGVFNSPPNTGWQSPGNFVDLNVITGGTGNTTWYVRPDGGTPFVNSTQTPSGQCSGMVDAAYSGSGTDQPCAMGNIRDLWDDLVSYENGGVWMISGGDTVIVRQNPNGYPTGNDTSDPTAGVINCKGVPYGCHMPSVPSGTAAQHTRILGENYANCHSNAAKTLLFVTNKANEAIDIQDSQFVDVACFEISDKAACSSDGNFTNHCGSTDNWGQYGVVESALSSYDNLTDLNIHGMAGEGIHGASGVGLVVDHVRIAGNAAAGMDMDDSPWTAGNISVAGGLTLTNSMTEFSGCVEEYPIVHNYPYIECRDQNTGGYGDGFGTASTDGDWNFDHDVWRYNFQDGLDLLHSGMNSLIVTNSQSYGEDGNAFKIGSGKTIVFRNNFIDNNCNRIAYTFGDEPASAIVPNVSTCRAGGGGVVWRLDGQGKDIFQNNTLVGYGAVSYEIGCTGGWDSCTHARTKFENNATLGYANSLYNNDEAASLFYEDTPALDMPANTGWAVRDHNLYFNLRHGCPKLLTGEICANPHFINQPALSISTESVLDNYNFSPSAGSPLIGAGISIQELATDNADVARPIRPSIGAREPSRGPGRGMLLPSPKVSAGPPAPSDWTTLWATYSLQPEGFVGQRGAGKGNSIF